MADPVRLLNPSNVCFVDTDPAVSQPTPVSDVNPLPVTIVSGGTDQDVNLVGINGAAPVVGHGVAAAALRVELPTDGTGVVGLIAGTAIVGKVGIDQTTPGTTNGVVLAQSALAAAGNANVVSSALETGHVIKAGAGNLYGFTVTTTTVAGYVQIFNSTTVPAAGAVTPVDAFYVGAFGSVSRTYEPPLHCAAGISIAFSSAVTPFTKTDSATAFISAQAV